ncbi:hypothetical protein Cgig2_008340 [Carnegiea gigantea]|uniref:Uncharacterized protein n=1 Tax=Carnegiea gigantea TaxID=171969 RepID=A0A9Q1QDH6_9CARY|nr:hypothetical protein Cgig2_008340 [Carnegiea gigantea]
MADLHVTTEVIRPETYIMATLMASRQRISLAPTVLGYIYHGLGEAASHTKHPSWLAELFSCLYCHRPDSDCPGDFSTLVRSAGLLGKKFPYPNLDTFLGMGDIFLLELALIVSTLVMGLPEEDFKFLLSIWPAVLPIHLGAELLLELYCPNRFALQFGFDQGVPSNRLSFIRAL